MLHFTLDELKALGMSLPDNPSNIRVSRKASLYNAHLMNFGDNIRIDDFCVLSGNIKIGSFVHIGAFCALYGGDRETNNENFGIQIENFCTISPKATIFATNDDFSGEYLISPMVEQMYCNVKCIKVILNKHTQICSNSIILPNVICGEGTVLGAMSLLKNDTIPFSIYVGIPARKIKNRSKNILNLEKQFLEKFSFMGGGRREIAYAAYTHAA